MMATPQFFNIDWIGAQDGAQVVWLMIPVALHLVGAARDSLFTRADPIRALADGRKRLPSACLAR